MEIAGLIIAGVMSLVFGLMVVANRHASHDSDSFCADGRYRAVGIGHCSVTGGLMCWRRHWYI